MGFLEDAIIKTKEAFDIACKKTDEVVSVEKLKFNISTIKKNREKEYVELGKIYFEKIKDSTELNEDEQKIVNGIIKKNAEIEELNREISNYKNN
ncbi:MAG: hypothetical protein IKJ93_00860 [Clostridia bacterium]|nr:hypothetical protein [Clostridia bacterium]